MKSTEVIRLVLYGGIWIRSFSLGRNGFPGGRCPEFGFWDALSVLVIVFSPLCVLCEEIDSLFCLLCGIISLIFRINVLLFEFVLSERGKFRDEAEVLP